MQKTLLPFLFLFLLAPMANAQDISDFEHLLAEGDSIFNGIDGTTEFSSGGAIFPLRYDTSFGGFWASGWAVSSVQDSSTSGFENLYGAKAFKGNRQSETYAVAQQNAGVRFQEGAVTVGGVYLTNSTYAHNSMRDGDDFAKQFGGPEGTDPDFFRLIIRGFMAGDEAADSIVFYLADYRFEEDSLDYLVNDWRFVDLSPLGVVDSLGFDLESSDVGAFGINTPLFFCMDDLVLPQQAPEYIANFETPFLGFNGTDDGSDGAGGFELGPVFLPNTYLNDPFFGGFWSAGWALSGSTDSLTSGFGNLLSAVTGKGLDNSFQYAIGQQNAVLRLQGTAAGNRVQGLYLTNTTYAYNSMRDGDDFAKQFGGPDGSDPDFFRLTIRKYLNGQLGADSVEFFLADYRFERDSLDYILNDWTFVDLQELGPADSLLFTLSSSDVGEFGINTPLFFAIDQLILADPAIEDGIAGDSSAIVAWATGALVDRGLQDIRDPSSDTTTVGTLDAVLGSADGTTLSLGDKGMVNLTFEKPITNGDGPDFVVFENGFPSGDAYFLELAVVEVSSDGQRFFRFPPTSLTDTSVQVDGFGTIRPENIRNLAGRYPGRVGTPFDLAELEGIEGLDVNQVTHVRIIDVVGSLDPDLATFDKDGRAINDPFPTPFASGGFDLDAVGVLHQGEVTNVKQVISGQLRVYPNPVTDLLRIDLPEDWEGGIVRIFNLQGQFIEKENVQTGVTLEISLGALSSGVYLLQLEGQGKRFIQQIIKQ